MTITLRNTILAIAVSLALIITIIFTLTVAHIIINAPDMLIVEEEILNNITPNNRLYNIIVSLFYLLLSLTCGIVLTTYFKKSTSEEIFFFILAVVSFCFEALRSEQLLVQLYDEPAYYGAVMTRVVHFGRFFRTSSLFFAGLFAAGLTYQKYGIFIGVSILIAFAYAGTVTVDTSTLLDDLLYKIGNSRETAVALIALQGFAALNFFLGGFLRNNPDYAYMGGGIVLLVVGSQLLHLQAHIAVFGIGVLCIVGGIVLFSNRVHSVYMWY